MFIYEDIVTRKAITFPMKFSHATNKHNGHDGPGQARRRPVRGKTVHDLAGILVVDEYDQAGMNDFGHILEENLDEVLIDAFTHAIERGAISIDRIRAIAQLNTPFRQRALFDGEWDSYLKQLRTFRAEVTERGMALLDWYRIATAFRFAMLSLLFGAYDNSLAQLGPAISAMEMFVDNAVAALSVDYMLEEHAAIEELSAKSHALSIPVLQVREQLLIAPLIGEFDAIRARQMTGQILQAIGQMRAKVMVIDITGLFAVDSAVVTAIMQVVEAAKLMGATVLLTGMSTAIAASVVSLRADLGDLRTLGDLQSGIEEAEHLLGYIVARSVRPDLPAGSVNASTGA